MSDRLSVSSCKPSFVDKIDLGAIASLAITARHRTTSLTLPCSVDRVPELGSFNVVWFIDFADGVRWVFRVPIAEWTPTLEKRLRSDIVGMQFIQSNTTIPIPPIHDFSVVPENPVGRPYMLMERATGTQLCKLWFDPAWFTEGRRKSVFKSLVSIMSQLRAFEFPAIGRLDFDPKSHSHIVAALLPSLEGAYHDERAIQYCACIFTRRDHQANPFSTHNGSQSLPSAAPHFRWDPTRHLTDHRLIDWDGIVIGPRQGGYARYPSWITRDWDPLMYGYPGVEDVSHVQQEGNVQSDGEEECLTTPATLPRSQLQEDSPSTLQAFREEYLAAFTQVDPISARFTRHSHVFEALEIAIALAYCRGHIIEKLSRYVFGPEAQCSGTLSSWDLKQGIITGDWLKQMDRPD